MLFTDFYLGLGRVCKTLFILNTFLGSYIFQYFEAVGWKHLYNVPVLEGFQPHDIWQRQRNPSTARIVFRLVWRRAPPSCMGPLIWSGYHEKAFTKPKNQAKNLKDSKSGLRFFSFLFVLFCFLAADSGWDSQFQDRDGKSINPNFLFIFEFYCIELKIMKFTCVKNV